MRFSMAASDFDDVAPNGRWKAVPERIDGHDAARCRAAYRSPVTLGSPVALRPQRGRAGGRARRTAFWQQHRRPTSASSLERRTVGTLLDPGPARPAPAHGPTLTASCLLREPVGERDIAQFVQTFLDAWRRESLDDLDSLLSQGSDTGPIEALGSRYEKPSSKAGRQRLKAHAHEYARLESDLVAVERIEHWDSDEVGRVRGRACRETTLRMGDVYVAAPLRVTSGRLRQTLRKLPRDGASQREMASCEW
jgi:hypothetical protein